MNKSIKTILLLLIFSIIRTYAQEKWEVTSDIIGKYTYAFYDEAQGSYNSSKNYQLSASEIAIIKQKMQSISDILKKNKVFNPCQGFDAVVKGEFTYNSMAPNQKAYKLLTSRFPQWEIYFELTGFLKSSSGKIKHYGGQPAEILCRINSLNPSSGAFENYRETGYDYDVDLNNAIQKMNEIFRKPMLVKQIKPGVTAFSDGTLFIYKPGKPIWKSVTFEEYFDLLQNMFVQQEIKNKITPDGPNSLIPFLKKDREEFPSEWMKMPCQSAENLMKTLSIEYTDLPKLSGIFPIYGDYMRINSDYFNKSLPKTAIQVIILTPAGGIDGDCRSDEAWYDASCKFISDVDFDSLQSLIDN